MCGIGKRSRYIAGVILRFMNGERLNELARAERVSDSATIRAWTKDAGPQNATVWPNNSRDDSELSARKRLNLLWVCA